MTYNIKVASYINSKSKFAKVIRLQQRLQGFEPRFSNLSHTELVFDYVDDKQVFKRLKQLVGIRGENTLTEPELFKSNNLWFSSSERDGGTRFKFIEDNKNSWVYHNIEITKQEYLDLLDYYISINNLPYAWWSIVFTQGLKTLWFDNEDKNFCTEAVLKGLQKVLHILCGVSAVTYNPAKLAKGLEDNNY